MLIVMEALLIHWMLKDPEYRNLTAYSSESDGFRSMKLGESIAQSPSLDVKQLTAWMITNDFDLCSFDASSNGTFLDNSYEMNSLLRVKPIEFQKLCKAYETILADLVYFPIPASTDSKVPSVSFEDSWQDERTYGGKRRHEGCDIMGDGKPRGFYPVISMSDGTIEKIGWLEQGGWRIGIRSPHGAYLYYAHLYNYSQEWKEGDMVKAGELLGFMGDSGYSLTEGAVGNFPVHLHLGIYLATDHHEELSVNPYWILKYLTKFQLKYAYS